MSHQSSTPGYTFFPRDNDGQLHSLRPELPDAIYKGILKILRENAEKAMDHGDVKAVLGYVSVITGLTHAIQAIQDACEIIDAYSLVLDHNEKGILERIEAQRQAAQSAHP